MEMFLVGIGLKLAPDWSMEARMQTPDEELTAILGGPDLTERLKGWDAEFAATRPGHEGLFLLMILTAAAIGDRAVGNFPSKAYGPYLKDRGANPVWASRVASLAISLGVRRSKESRQLGTIVEAFKFLAQGKRQRRAILPRAKVLLAAHDETSIVDQIFREAGLHDGEFVHLLKVAVNGGPLACDRIREIAAAVVPSLPSARGRKASAASAAHEQFLEFDPGGPRAYTYDNNQEDFVDERTKATRLEFNDLDFDPRPACRRFAAAREKATWNG